MQFSAENLIKKSLAGPVLNNGNNEINENMAFSGQDIFAVGMAQKIRKICDSNLSSGSCDFLIAFAGNWLRDVFYV